MIIIQSFLTLMLLFVLLVNCVFSCSFQLIPWKGGDAGEFLWAGGRLCGLVEYLMMSDDEYA